jgi:glucosyl-3-phosphoglycerate synthase
VERFASQEPSRRPRHLSDLARDWYARRTYRGADYPLHRVLHAKGDASVAVIVPTRNVAATVADVVARLLELQAAGVVDTLIVIDGGSTDSTPQIATAAGATVVDQREVLPEVASTLGKGDAMWRALSLTSADLVCFVDADSEPFFAGYVLGLLGPILENDALQLVRGAYSRPFRSETGVQPFGGGRVTELVARPLLSLFYPELCGFEQPLAGEFVLRRELARGIAFPEGYGVEIATLIDTFLVHGLDALGQSELGFRQNRHQDLRDLSAMAQEVAVAVLARSRSAPIADLHREGLIRPLGGTVASAAIATAERPPLREVVPWLAAQPLPRVAD